MIALSDDLAGVVNTSSNSDKAVLASPIDRLIIAFMTSGEISRRPAFRGSGFVDISVSVSFGCEDPTNV
jgi:hypothetical protein